MNELTTFEEVRSKLAYESGLVESLDQAVSPVQRQFFIEAKRQIANIDAVYFSGDIPVVYFKLLNTFDEESVKHIHRCIWNQNRIPLLYVITPGELRIYNCFEVPAEPGKLHTVNTEERLIRHFELAVEVLNDFEEFSKPQIDSGAFWKSEIGQQFYNNQRVDQKLLEELRKIREHLNIQGLSYHHIHNLLGRSIFILYLEDRGAIKLDYYNRFLEGAVTYTDILEDKDATYNLFEHLEKKFNGDLFPVHNERQVVDKHHLEQVRELFRGTNLTTGQRMLWRPYDFGIIPIEFISAIYEQFLHKEEGKDYTSEMGAYYTPHPLVEFILNEVLPWPNKQDCRYDLRILDPTCGSGIFLVEAFRRLVARWLFSNEVNEIPHRKLREILTQFIYGIDVNIDAIRVAAFSLYLALLDYLEPKTIWEEFRFPKLVFNTNDPDNGGQNLFPMDVFSTNGSNESPFANSSYDIVVGNPPWKRDGLPKHISEYCQNRKFAQEMSQAFLWRVRNFAPNGIIALVATSNVLFNIEENDSTFRREFFSENHVKAVINFSALRNVSNKVGKKLFASAIGPASVFIYQPFLTDESSPILYCSPKPTRANIALPAIVVDSSEIKFLPREKCKSSDIIWKIAMWATERDLEFVERLLSKKSLADYIEEREWHWAQGLQRPGKTGPFHDEEIAAFSLLPTKAVQRYRIDKTKFEKIEAKYFFRTGNKKTYRAPHVLLRRSPSQNKMQAVYVDIDCAFKNAVSGIAAKESPELLKALAAYLNSSFVPYFTFLTASLWGIERDQVSKTEFGKLPGIIFEMPVEVVADLASKVDTIQQLIATEGLDSHRRITNIEKEIDRIFYDALELSHTERILISDMLNYSLDFFYKGDDSKACDSVSIDEVIKYTKMFCDAINSILQFGQLRAWSTVYSGEAPLRLISIHFNRLKDAGTIDMQDSSEKLKNSLANLERKIQTEYSESIYIRRSIKFYDGDTLHITKPNEVRFWSRTMALRDADETLAEGIHGAN